MHSKYLRVGLSLLAATSVVLTAATTAFGENLLKGKVEHRDQPTRIKRPAMPVLTAVERPDTVGKLHGKVADTGSHLDLGEDDFMFEFKKMSPMTDDTASGVEQSPKTASTRADSLNGEVESADLIIAWEEWHRRVCAAIFARWRANGTLPGVARTTLRFTRDRHVNVIIREIHLDADIYEVLPAHARHQSLPELEQAFAQTVLDSVTPLDGALLLEFPEKSRRKVVQFSPAFRGTRGPAGYNWRKDDYERVPVN